MHAHVYVCTCVCVHDAVFVHMCLPVTELLAGGFLLQNPLGPLSVNVEAPASTSVCPRAGVGQGIRGQTWGPHMEHLLPEPPSFPLGDKFHFPSQEFSSGELHPGPSSFSVLEAGVSPRPGEGAACLMQA